MKKKLTNLDSWKQLSHTRTPHTSSRLVDGASGPLGQTSRLESSRPVAFPLESAGDAGTTFYILFEGEVAVSVDGHLVTTTLGGLNSCAMSKLLMKGNHYFNVETDPD